jgi:hypothetical protein
MLVSFFSQILTMGPMASFGLIFGQYLTDLGKGTKSITLITSTLFTAYSLTGNKNALKIEMLVPAGQIL